MWLCATLRERYFGAGGFCSSQPEKAGVMGWFRHSSCLTQSQFLHYDMNKVSSETRDYRKKEVV